ncbi:MAG: hypothetical protein ABI443_10115 [Chthoniobacterales bacterium]
MSKQPPSEGHPLDDVHYREYKILLKADRFTRPEEFENYWKIISKIAKDLGVKVTTNKDGFQRLVREVLFYDTEKFDLYNNSFILRKRTFYKDGWPEEKDELTIKFRNSDVNTAAATDIMPRMSGESRIKFKEEVLPLKDTLGEMRVLYSHNCEVSSANVVLTKGLEDISSVFPALGGIDVSPKEKIELVNNVAVEEVQVDVGSFDFGHGYTSNATVAIWRNRASETSLVGEFAFQAKFKRYDEVHRKPRELSEIFFKAAQTEAAEWVLLGTTKTAIVYRLGSAVVSNHE